jgi:hypothetical protein
MKKIRLSVLSLLLFTFSFFAIHDYVMDNVDADTRYELCYMQCDYAVVDLPSQIHDHIHISMAVPDIEASLFPSFLSSARPLYLPALFDSNILSTLQRPPLV